MASSKRDKRSHSLNSNFKEMGTRSMHFPKSELIPRNPHARTGTSSTGRSTGFQISRLFSHNQTAGKEINTGTNYSAGGSTSKTIKRKSGSLFENKLNDFFEKQNRAKEADRLNQNEDIILATRTKNGREHILQTLPDNSIQKTYIKADKKGSTRIYNATSDGSELSKNTFNKDGDLVETRFINKRKSYHTTLDDPIDPWAAEPFNEMPIIHQLYEDRFPGIFKHKPPTRLYEHQPEIRYGYIPQHCDMPLAGSKCTQGDGNKIFYHLQPDFERQPKTGPSSGPQSQTHETERAEAFELAGLTPGEDYTDQELKTAFKKAARNHHPDKCMQKGMDPKEATRRFQLLNKYVNPESKALVFGDESQEAVSRAHLLMPR